MLMGRRRLLSYQPRDRSRAQAQLIGHPPDRAAPAAQSRESCHRMGIMLGAWPSTYPCLSFGTVQPGDSELTSQHAPGKTNLDVG